MSLPERRPSEMSESSVPRHPSSACLTWPKKGLDGWAIEPLKPRQGVEDERRQSTEHTPPSRGRKRWLVLEAVTSNNTVCGMRTAGRVMADPRGGMVVVEREGATRSSSQESPSYIPQVEDTEADGLTS